jgi:hypothetical protein
MIGISACYRVLAELPCGSKPVHHGHAQIHQNDVVGSSERCRDGLFTIDSSFDAMPARVEQQLHQMPQIRVVFRNEDHHHMASSDVSRRGHEAISVVGSVATN